MAFSYRFLRDVDASLKAASEQPSSGQFPDLRSNMLPTPPESTRTSRTGSGVLVLSRQSELHMCIPTSLSPRDFSESCIEETVMATATTGSQAQSRHGKLQPKEDQDTSRLAPPSMPSTRDQERVTKSSCATSAVFESKIIRQTLQNFRERALDNAKKFAEEVLSNGSSLSSEDGDRSDSDYSSDGDGEWGDVATDNVRLQSPKSGPGSSPARFEENRGQTQPTSQQMFNTQSPSSGSDSSSPTTRANETAGKTDPSDSIQHGDKRKRSMTSSIRNGGDEENEDEDDRPTRKKPNQSPNVSEVTYGKKLACPFFKRRPARNPKARACVYPGFSNVASMKEHLYRHHLCIVCPRCDEAFKDSDTLYEHQNSKIACELVEEKAEREGITLAQEKQLKCKKRRKGECTEEKKWEGVYRILFPTDTTIPSPYCEATAITQMSPSTALFADFEEFSSRQLRTLVMEGIEAEVRRQEVVLEAALMDRIEDIVRNANQQLFQQWREHQSLTQVEPGPSNNATFGPTDTQALLAEPAAELAAMVVPPPEMDFDQLLSTDFTIPTTSNDPVHSVIPSHADSAYGSSQTSDKTTSNGGAAAGSAHHYQPQTESLPMRSTRNGRWHATISPQGIHPGNMHTPVPTSSLSDIAFLDNFPSFPDSIPQGSPTAALGTFSSSSQWDTDWMYREFDGASTQFDYWRTIGDKLAESSGGVLPRAEEK